MAISTTVEFVRYILRKERGAFLSIEEICTNLDRAQLDLFNELFAMYAGGQRIHDGLRPFKKQFDFTSSSTGAVVLPNDYLHMVGSPYTGTLDAPNEVSMVNEDEWPSAVNSQLRAVSTTDPIARLTETGLQLHPRVEQSGFLTYLRRPKVPNATYTVSGRVQTYTTTGSTQDLEFSEVFHNNIIAKSLRYAGISLDEQGVMGFAESYNQQTT